MFYDYKIELWSKGVKHKDKIGQTYYKDIKKIATIECDIQPYSKEQAYKEYGITTECSNRLFMGLTNDIIVNEQEIHYKNRVYEIVKIVEWEETEDKEFNFKEVIINEVYR